MAKKKTLSRLFNFAAATALLASLSAAPAAMADDNVAEALSAQQDTAITIANEAGPDNVPFNVFATPTLAQAQSALPDGTFVAQGQTGPQQTVVENDSSSSLEAGPISFMNPWMLLGLGALPFLWLLMRSIPPKPREVDFPAIKFLMELEDQDQQPARMPIWQRILGLTAAGALILGASDPVFNPDTPLEGDGPVMIVVDNGWASASDWSSRTDEMERVIALAEKDGRQIILVPTAADEDGSPIRATGTLSADDARQALTEIQPQPWPVDREAAMAAVQSLGIQEDITTFWLSNGLNDSGALALAEALNDLGSLTVLQDDADSSPVLLVPPAASGADLTVKVQRANSSEEETFIVTATNMQGLAIQQLEVTMEEGVAEMDATFDVPSDLRNEITRISINGENSAGGVVLLDERWKRRPVGVVEVRSSLSGQPLLEETHYIRSAIDPYVDLYEGNLGELLDRDLSVLILTDDIAISEENRARLDQWVKDGGTLLRFAGPRLAEQPNDNLVPVTLREGERELGGALSGTERGQLAAFDEDSPFYGNRINTPVSIDRQIIAEPGPELESRTWAELEDGSPLVTGARNGDGWMVLVHTTADADWSNLALSGVFVDMMRTIVSQSQGVTQTDEASLDRSAAPLQTLNGLGQLTDPGAAATPITTRDILDGDVSAQHPPGYYGNESSQQAHNLATGVASLEPLPDLPAGAERAEYTEGQTENDLSGPLLAGGLAVMLAYWAVLMGQQGHLPGAPGKNKSKSNTQAQRNRGRSPKPS